jgi:N-acetylglucosaminylphosphatidylinositol deacetylase
MEELTLILTSILGFCTMFYALAAYIRPYSMLKAIPRAKRVLLVIAHPDDETMFFGPTVVQLCRQKETDVHLLCLSNGDYRNRGRVRKRELYKACEVMGVREENITVLR